MSTAVLTDPTIQHVEVSDETITAHLVDGRVISVPLAWSWRLSEATPAQRANWRLIGNGHGVHWPDVDEDISAEGMLSGIPARRRSGSRRAIERPADQLPQPASRTSRATRTKRMGRPGRG